MDGVCLSLCYILFDTTAVYSHLTVDKVPIVIFYCTHPDPGLVNFLVPVLFPVPCSVNEPIRAASRNHEKSGVCAYGCLYVCLFVYSYRPPGSAF